MEDKRGLSLLLIVVIVGSAALVMILSSSLIGLSEASESYAYDQYRTAQLQADGCVDEALRQLRLDDAYIGDSLSFGSGSCIISVSSVTSTKTILVTSTVGVHHANAYVVASVVSSSISILGWE